MLLYDEVLRQAMDRGRTFRDAVLAAALQRAEVFVLDNVVHLLPDWEQGRTQPIPKRPPFRTTWAEWRFTELGTGDWQGKDLIWHLGVLIDTCSREQLSEIFDKNAQGVHEETRREFLEDLEEYYLCMRFDRCISANYRMDPDMRQLSVQMGVILFGMKDNSTVVRTVGLYPSMDLRNEALTDAQKMQCLHDEYGAFQLPIAWRVYRDPFYQVMTPWPPLMAFALLHCKNVSRTQIDPPPKLAKQTIRRGRPPLCSYHVLQLHLNELRSAEQSDEEPDENRRHPRFHLVRGHFKYLQHPRFREKGWHWWPAHWRGDPTLGAVTKDYAVVP